MQSTPSARAAWSSRRTERAQPPSPAGAAAAAAEVLQRGKWWVHRNASCLTYLRSQQRKQQEQGQRQRQRRREQQRWQQCQRRRQQLQRTLPRPVVQPGSRCRCLKWAAGPAWMLREERLLLAAAAVQRPALQRRAQAGAFPAAVSARPQTHSRSAPAAVTVAAATAAAWREGVKCPSIQLQQLQQRQQQRRRQQSQGQLLLWRKGFQAPVQRQQRQRQRARKGMMSAASAWTHQRRQFLCPAVSWAELPVPLPAAIPWLRALSSSESPNPKKQQAPQTKQRMPLCIT